MASLVALAFVGAACGGHETAASRSAAAYDEAQRKGTPVEKGEHGGHAAPAGEKQAEPATAATHAEHAGSGASSGAKTGADHAAMPGMDHAHMTGSGSGKQPAATGMDHSKMAGMDHARTAASGTDTQHAGMDHSKTATTDHAAMGHAAPMPPPAPEPVATSAQPGQPAATLRADSLDGPATTSLTDAQRSQAMAKEMAGGHGMQHGMPYRQLDAGRDSEPSPAPAAKPSPHRHEDSR